MSVGNVMQEGKSRAWKTLAFVAGLLVYIGGLGYSLVHNWALLTAGVDNGMILWAALGVVTLELTALSLPLALHFWFYDTMQRIAGFAFYLLDAALVILNVVIDYSLTASAGAEIPYWLQLYKFYALPATPIFCAAGWSLMFLLDPSSKERATLETLRASTRQALAVRIAEAAKAVDIGDQVDAAAFAITQSIVSDTLGGAMAASGRAALPAGHQAASLPQPTEPRKNRTNSNGNGNGHQAGAAWLRWPKMTRRGRVTYNAEAEAVDPGPLSGEE